MFKRASWPLLLLSAGWIGCGSDPKPSTTSPIHINQPKPDGDNVGSSVNPKRSAQLNVAKFAAIERFDASKLDAKTLQAAAQALIAASRQERANAKPEDAEAVVALLNAFQAASAQPPSGKDALKIQLSQAPTSDGKFVLAINAQRRQTLKFEIFDEEGFELARQNQLTVGSGTTYNLLDINDLEGGQYVVRIQNEANAVVLQTLELLSPEAKGIFKSLPNATLRPEQVKILNLSGQKMSLLRGEDFAKFVNLEILDVSNTQINSIPRLIGSLGKLRELRVRDNKLRDLPAEIGQLKNLVILDVSNNWLETLPEELGTLPKLEELTLSNNRLGVVFNDWSGLKQLRKLDLSQNKIAVIPKSTNNLLKLNELRLQQNNLREFPSEMLSLLHVQYLDISDNPMRTFPDGLKNWSELRTLVAKNVLDKTTAKGVAKLVPQAKLEY